MLYDVQGAGPSVVLVHSLLTDARAFDSIVPMLAEKHRVLRVSLPGFGSTPPLDIPNPSVFDLAEVVFDCIADNAAVDDAAVVVGNGLGAFVALALAITHGPAFGPLVIANGGFSFSDQRRVAFATMSDLVIEGGMDAVVDVAVRRIFPEPYIAVHPEVVEQRRDVLVETNPIAFAANCRALRTMDLGDQVATITNPTLVIAGGADATTPPEMARDLASRIPGAELVELADCGHCPPLEQPVQFVSAIRSFVERAT